MEKGSKADKRLVKRPVYFRGGDKAMKLSERGMDGLVGIVLGATIGLHYPLDGFKLLFVILSVVGILKLAVK